MMDWSDLASTALPTLPEYRSSVFHQSDCEPNPPTMPQLAAVLPSSSAPSENYRSVESLDAFIDRHEREVLSTLLQRCTDETHQRTSQTAEAHMQATWERERAVALKEIIGSRSLSGLWSFSSAAAASNRFGLSERTHVALLAATPFGAASSEKTSRINLDPTLVLDHLKVVERIGDLSSSEIIEHFERLASDAVARCQFSSTMMGYVSAWQLLSHLAGASPSPFDQAKATLSHFCKQFQVTVSNRVSQASLAGQDTTSSYSNDIAAQCQTYSRVMTGDTDPWTIGFFCLRCGDATAALQVLHPIAEPLVVRILSSMAHIQGNAVCIWDQKFEFPLLDSSDRRLLGNLLGESAPTSSMNVYKKAVISLLAANSPWPFSFKSTEGLTTIEDFLMGSLWIAVLQSNPVDRLIEFGETVMKFGPSFFEDPFSGGWVFSLPLLATQHSQKALMWLAESGGPFGLLQAVHIGIVMFLAGIPIRNLGHGDTVADGSLANLLVAYSKEVHLELGSLAALEYLMLIPNKVRRFKEVAMLIVATGEIDKLIGSLNTEGMRHGGAMSKYCSESEFSAILIETSDRFSEVYDDQQKTGDAVKCLMLAARYDDALNMMNSLLAPPYKNSIDRKFWIGQVASFHSHYINRRTKVLDALERSGKTSLIRTSLLLLDLNLFFERLSSGNQGSECLSIAQKTQLLPLSIADIQIKQVEFRELDPLLRDSLPFLLMGVMKILSTDYIILKRDIHRDTSGVTRERLNELKEKAKLYATFAATIGIECGQVGILTEMMSLMI